MRQALCVALCLTIFLVGCAGRTANPVQVQRLNDERRSIEAIQSEIAEIDQQIAEKKKTRHNIAVGNVVLGVTGFFVIVPWFFMNFKDAEGTEIEALKQRQTWLTSIVEEKGAGTAVVESPASNP